MTDTKPSDVDGLIAELLDFADSTGCLDVPLVNALTCAATTLAAQQARIDHMRHALHSAVSFVEALADNDPDEPIADNGMTVLGKLQYDAPALAIALRAALKEPS